MKYSFLFFILLYVSCQPMVEEDKVAVNEVTEWDLWMDSTHYQEEVEWNQKELKASTKSRDLYVGDYYPLMMKPLSFSDSEALFWKDFLED